MFDQAAFIASHGRKDKVVAFLEQFRNSQVGRKGLLAGHSIVPYAAGFRCIGASRLVSERRPRQLAALLASPADAGGVHHRALEVGIRWL